MQKNTPKNPPMLVNNLRTPKKDQNSEKVLSLKNQNKLSNTFSSVSSSLVWDGSNTIEDIQHIDFKELPYKKSKALTVLDKEGFLVIRNAIEKSTILGAVNHLESYLSDLGLLDPSNNIPKKYKTEILTGSKEIIKHPNFK